VEELQASATFMCSKKRTARVNYMLWVRMPKRRVTDSYTWIDALPVIGYNSPFNPCPLLSTVSPAERLDPPAQSIVAAC
jgi:hypothetical protein